MTIHQGRKPERSDRWLLRLGCGVLTLALLATGCGSGTAVSTSGGAVSRESAVSVSEPTGSYPVGTRELHLVDADRPDPWRPASGPRELMASLWYPTTTGAGAPAQYMSPEVARLTTEGLGIPVPAGPLSEVRHDAAADVPPLPGKWPLVVISPGFGHPRSTVTGLAEELASRGFVVATIDHAYEAAIEFPGERVLDCGRPRPCEAKTMAELQHVVRNRGKDLSFVLDRLTGPTSPWDGSRYLDATRIGVAGHSIGGASAVETARRDDRVDAAVNMDGTFYQPDSLAGSTAPVLLLGNGSRLNPEFDPSWGAAWPHLAGWKREILVRGFGHSSFTDWTELIDQLDVRDQYPPNQMEEVLGTVPGQRATRITRAYVVDMFDRHLRGGSGALLDRPAPEYPEVVFPRNR